MLLLLVQFKGLIEYSNFFVRFSFANSRIMFLYNMFALAKYSNIEWSISHTANGTTHLQIEQNIHWLHILHSFARYTKVK